MWRAPGQDALMLGLDLLRLQVIHLLLNSQSYGLRGVSEMEIGGLLTTAMAVMPHRDAERALRTALSLDVPFWPQLPLLSYYEDMYVQASEHFPGIWVDMEKRTISFSMDRFIAEFEEVLAHFEEAPYFDISETYSTVYHRFLQMDLSGAARDPWAARRADKLRAKRVRTRTNGPFFLTKPYAPLCSTLWRGV